MPLDAALWPNVARLLSGELGGPLRRLHQLSRPRVDRITWAADAAGIGEVIVKARFRDRAGAKTRSCARNLHLLAARGYPVPEYLWIGRLDRNWYLVVQRRLPGQPASTPNGKLLRELLSLVELQTNAGIEAGRFDMTGYHSLVLFEGWDHFRHDAEAASAESRRVCARLTRLLRPVWGHRLDPSDFAHGDLNLSNVLMEGSTITGVVDWDEFGVNSRSADLTSILFDWYRLQLPDEPGPGERGAKDLLERIVAIADEPGLWCTVSYAAVMRLAMAHRRRQQDALAEWIDVANRVLDSVGAK